MCTAITYQTKNFYFGRTLDHDRTYGEEVTVVPRQFPLPYVNSEHYAIIGMAHVADGFPLLYDAVNEKGLAMAGLNFVGNAHFGDTIPGKENIPSFAFIPWILAQCESVDQARLLLEGVNITSEAFRPKYTPAQLHWILADCKEAITIESTLDGINIYQNTPGVLTNNPPFNKQMFHLNNFMNLTPKSPKNRFSLRLELDAYSNGMGAIGLPGDLSSQSRFVRAAFTKLNSVSGSDEEESITQFFHILETVSQTQGCCQLPDGGYEKTVYTSCCNCDKGIYYYTTYENRQITAVDMHREMLDSDTLSRYPLVQKQQISWQNR